MTATTMSSTFHTAVPNAIVTTAMNFPITISARSAGLMSKVSIVPRSFSPAQRSTAG